MWKKIKKSVCRENVFSPPLMAPCIFPEIMVATFFSKISFFPSGCWTLKINFGWNNTVCSKDMEIGSFPQKWMWRPYMVDLCSIPFDASRRPLQFICGSQTPTECSFDARVDKPPKRSKMGGFPQKFHRSTRKSQIPESPRYRFRDIRYESFKKTYF